MMTPYFIFSKIPPTHFLSFSHPGIGRGWKCVEALIPTADQGVVPPWRKIVETFDICVLKYLWFLPFWTIVFCIFVISHFMDNIETNNFWRSTSLSQDLWNHIFHILKNDEEIFFTCLLLMIMMMSIEKALIVTLIMRIVAAMMVILKRPLCSRPLKTLTKRHNPLEVNV